MKIVLDTYVRRARLEPALIVALPLGLATLVAFPMAATTWALLWSLVTWSGGTTLLVNLARDRGKRREAALFRSWGGKPSTRLLRHKGNANPTLLARRHAQLETLVDGLVLPTAIVEAKDPDAADHAYETCVAVLLERTRKREQFPMVFEENCNYGFRRNLWGMKAIGMVLSVLSCTIIGMFVAKAISAGQMPQPLTGAAGLISLFLLLFWIFGVDVDWVRTPADEYAKQLLAACDSLGAASPGTAQ